MKASSRWLIWGIAAVLLVRLSTFFWFPLTDNTEARYAEIGRVMAELNDWVTPWFDSGVPFWGKPPLSFWMTAASIEVFGASEWAVRLPHAAAGLLVLWLTWDMGRQISNSVGMYAAALLSGSLIFILSTGAVMTDMALTLGTTLSFWGLGQAFFAPQRKWAGFVFFIGLAMGLLAKGPLALVLVMTPVVLWALWKQTWHQLWHQLPWVTGLVLTLILTLPWYVWAELRTPGFLNYFLVGEHWQRFVTPGWQGDLYGTAHVQPKGTIWIYAAIDFLPWLLILPFLFFWRRSPDQTMTAPTHSPSNNWLGLWALIALFPAAFFTMAGNILWTYVLPGWPAWVLVVAIWLDRHIQEKAIHHALTWGLFLAAFGTLATFGYLTWNGQAQNFSAHAVVEQHQSFNQTNNTEHLLGFYPQTPASAKFYSAGQVHNLSDQQQLQSFVRQHPGAYVAQSVRTTQPLPKPDQGHWVKIDTFGRYDLFKHQPQ